MRWVSWAGQIAIQKFIWGCEVMRLGLSHVNSLSMWPLVRNVHCEVVPVGNQVKIWKEWMNLFKWWYVFVILLCWNMYELVSYIWYMLSLYWNEGYCSHLNLVHRIVICISLNKFLRSDIYIIILIITCWVVSSPLCNYFSGNS